LKVNWLHNLEDNLSILEERLLVLERQFNKLGNDLYIKEQELKQTNQQLEYAHQQMLEQHRLVVLGSLVAGILHEVNNPLQLVIGFAQLSSFSLENLQKELQEDLPQLSNIKQEKIEKIISEIKTNISTIEEQGINIVSNVNNMLLQARISSSQTSKVDINELIDRALPIVANSYKFKQENFSLKLETDYDKSLDKIEAFAEDLTKVITNLVKNCCDSVWQKKRRLGENFQPQIAIKTRKLDHYFLAITIRDNGEGIPDNLKEKIFQPYVTTKTAGEGTGLGLAIVRELIAHNQGQIKLRTEWGVYAEFMIILPITREHK
jgi:nitrogen-specific signal transduction histidine kinase